MNVAMHLIVEGTDPKDRQRVVDELTGPLRTLGGGLKPEEMNAPSWWHGDEDAYETAMAATISLPQRGRARRR